MKIKIIFYILLIILVVINVYQYKYNVSLQEQNDYREGFIHGIETRCGEWNSVEYEQSLRLHLNESNEWWRGYNNGINPPEYNQCLKS